MVARVCLDMLRSRKARPEDPVGPQSPERAVGREREAVCVLHEPGQLISGWLGRARAGLRPTPHLRSRQEQTLSPEAVIAEVTSR